MARPIRLCLTSIIQWFDAYAGTDTAKTADPKQVDWVRILPFAFMHAGCLGVFWVGWSPTAVWTAVYLRRRVAQQPSPLRGIGPTGVLLVGDRCNLLPVEGVGPNGDRHRSSSGAGSHSAFNEKKIIGFARRNRNPITEDNQP